MSAKSQTTNRLTRLGFHSLFLGTFAIFGGAFRGFNLLLVLAALLVGALIIQWRWSRNYVSRVSITRRLPREVFAGESFCVLLHLRNHNRFLNAWMLKLCDTICRFGSDDQGVANCGIASIGADETISTSYECLISQRGRYRFGPLSVETTFPFSLFRCRKVIQSHDEIYVLPRLLDLRRSCRQGMASPDDGISTTVRRTGSSEGEFFGLREWKQGDSPKWIHWRTSARLNEPVVRQFEQQRRFDLCIVVDAFAASGHDHQNAELAISLAATMLTKLDLSPTNRIVLGAAGEDHQAAIASGSVLDRHQMLVVLAELTVSPNPRIAQAFNDSVSLADFSTQFVVVSSRSKTEAFGGSDPATMLNVSADRSVNLHWIDVRNVDATDLAIRMVT